MSFHSVPLDLSEIQVKGPLTQKKKTHKHTPRKRKGYENYSYAS